MASAAQRRIKSISYAKYGYMFIAPFFLVYCFFQVWPLIQTFILSFQGNGADAGNFVGFDNYGIILFGSGEGMGRRAAAMQDLFLTSFKNTIILWFGNFIPQILLSLLLAVWFTDSKLHIPGVGFFKVVMYLPNIITAVSVAALFMRFISNSQLSAVNTLLMLNGGDPVSFEASAAWSRGIVMFIQTWLWFGNTMIMMMSGIMGINPSLFEAAAIDGASSGQVLRKVTLPLLTVLESVGEERRRELLARLARCHEEDESVEYLQHIVENEGGMEKAARVMQEYLTRAMSVLSEYEPSEYRDALANLCVYVGERDR